VQFFELVGSDLDAAVAELRAIGYSPGHRQRARSSYHFRTGYCD
jgi:hypothetical protein